MLMISIGTGLIKSKVQKGKKSKLLKRRGINWTTELPDMFMMDATEQNQYLMQYFSNARIPEKINDEAGDLQADLISESPLLDYCRYNVSLDSIKLAELDIHLTDKVIKSLHKMEKGQNAHTLYNIGKADAIKKVDSSHFPATFDFGLGKSKSPPISQEEVKNIFSPILNESGSVYKKYKGVFGKKAETEVEITSITSDGIETHNTAKKGDFIVKNQTESKEQYVVNNDKFEKRYKAIRKMPDGLWTEYSPTGQVRGVQLSENLIDTLNLDKHFFIMASWGQPQYVGIGDFIVNPINEVGFYRIGLKEFKETYALKKPQ